MKHKHLRTKEEWWDLDPRLRLILCDADLWCSQRRINFTITCLFRSLEEQERLYFQKQAPAKTSVHCFYRGGDARSLGMECMDIELANYINEKHQYDPARPHLKTCLIHGGTARHFHFQVRP